MENKKKKFLTLFLSLAFIVVFLVVVYYATQDKNILIRKTTRSLKADYPQNSANTIHHVSYEPIKTSTQEESFQFLLNMKPGFPITQSKKEDHENPFFWKKTSKKKYDLLVVGAGLSGATIAHLASKIFGYSVLIIDKRNHIAGNCYDYIDENSIRVSAYGAHIFHTKDKDIWDFVTKFSEFTGWQHRVKAYVDEQFTPIPVNIDTVNTLLKIDIKTTEEMDAWLAKHQVKFDHEPKNGEEAAKARVGEYLYEKFFKYYTKKQWDKYPSELAAEVLNRIPVRNNKDDRYFNDQFQGLPKEGYTKMVANMLNDDNIDVLLNINYFDLPKDEIKEFKKIIFSGKVDEFFDYKFGKLEYRSLDFVKLNFDQTVLPMSVINFPSLDVPYPRIVEYRHFDWEHGEEMEKNTKSTTVLEFSNDYGEPCYPVLTSENVKQYNYYKDLSEQKENENIVFVGRLANFKYLNMDVCIKNAVKVFEENFGVKNPLQKLK